MEPAADLCGRHRVRREGPGRRAAGFDITSYWARSGLLSMTRDAGVPPTWPVAGSGDNATAVGLYSAIVTALYRRERTGNGSYVTTSLLAEGVWSASVSIQAALSGRNSTAARSQEPRQCSDERLSRCRRHLVRSPRHTGQAGSRGKGDWPQRSADGSAVLRSGRSLRPTCRNSSPSSTNYSAPSRCRIGTRCSTVFTLRSVPCAGRKR